MAERGKQRVQSSREKQYDNGENCKLREEGRHNKLNGAKERLEEYLTERAENAERTEKNRGKGTKKRKEDLEKI